MHSSYTPNKVIFTIFLSEERNVVSCIFSPVPPHFWQSYPVLFFPCWRLLSLFVRPPLVFHRIAFLLSCVFLLHFSSARQPAQRFYFKCSLSRLARRCPNLWNILMCFAQIYEGDTCGGSFLLLAPPTTAALQRKSCISCYRLQIMLWFICWNLGRFLRFDFWFKTGGKAGGKRACQPLLLSGFGLQLINDTSWPGDKHLRLLFGQTMKYDNRWFGWGP